MWEDEIDERETALLEGLENNPGVVKALTQLQRSRALVVAVSRTNTKLASALLAEGASPNQEDEFGYTALMFAAMHGLKDCLKLMLQRPGCLINKRAHSMKTALHFAAKKGQWECVELLLTNGASVNVADDWGETALILAVIAGCLRTVGILLKNGARLDMFDLQGMDALAFAAREGHQEILKVLVEHGSSVNKMLKTSALHQAAHFGQVSCVETLLKLGAHPDLHDVHHTLPIAIATYTDKDDVVRCLLRHLRQREEVNVALVAAVKSNALRCLGVLLAHGARPDALDMQAVPAFFSAVALKHTDSVTCLIRHNVDVNRSLNKVYLLNTELRDIAYNLQQEHVTALTIAALRCYPHLVKILIQAGASAAPFRRLIDSNCVPTDLLAEDPGLVSWVIQKAKAPRSLSFQCRNQIRNHLQSDFESKIADLPLPKPIQEYLNFVDLEYL